MTKNEFKAGFVSFVGRPNVGKSTLTNAMVGAKIAITSSKPQTTRKAIRGVVHRPEGELIIVDTPGVHRPRTLLGERLNDLVESTLSDVDVIAFCVPANEAVGPGDRFIVAQLAKYPRANRVAIITKIDKASKERVAAQLLAVNELADWATIIPVSALTNEQVDIVTSELLALMPESPELYPSEAVTDEGLEDRVSELIREAALEGVDDELPHSIAVTIDEMHDRDASDLTDIHASLFVERESQKAIVIGRGGAGLRTIGMAARTNIEQLIGRRVYLDIRVKVAKDWQRSPKELGKLGF